MKTVIARLLPAMALSCLLWLSSLPGTAALAEPARVDMSLDIEPDGRSGFFDGEYISFWLSLEREGYVYLFYLDTQGNLLQLLPNAENSNHWFPRGNRMPFPSLEDPIDYVMSQDGSILLATGATDSTDPSTILEICLEKPSTRPTAAGP